MRRRSVLDIALLATAMGGVRPAPEVLVLETPPPLPRPPVEEMVAALAGKGEERAPRDRSEQRARRRASNARKRRRGWR